MEPDSSPESHAGATLDLSFSCSQEPAAPDAVTTPRPQSEGQASQGLAGSRNLTTESSASNVRAQSRGRPPLMRPRPSMMDFRATPTGPLNTAEGEEDDAVGALQPSPPMPPARPRTHGALFRPKCLSLSGSLSSLKASLTDPMLLSPGTPLPNREEFRQVEGGVSVVFFDFDGTLTATPGDRAARPMKQAELRMRAPMLDPRLKALRETGAALGIISKSTEATIRDALHVSGLIAHFEAPIVGKAVGFEGKAGIIEDLARKGSIPRLGGKSMSGQPVGRRVLLVDDDVLELERARDMGQQTYAAPAMGGLREEDFDVLLAGLRSPAPRRTVRTATSADQQALRRPPLWTAVPELSTRRRTMADISCCKTAAGKWRNLILFSGECFEG
mmetsp:Transcript_107125/g.345660  ORF Transcript_107125/g.345660 Transcript_107125/m.345660 type:complete len:388 (+) Transcript_107125:94-1257(+)